MLLERLLFFVLAEMWQSLVLTFRSDGCSEALRCVVVAVFQIKSFGFLGSQIVKNFEDTASKET